MAIPDGPDNNPSLANVLTCPDHTFVSQCYKSWNEETTLQSDPSDGIVVSVTNVQALVARVPAYTLWIIELCLISSTIRKAFSCTSQSCDLLWCIYVRMAILIMYIYIYLVSFSIYYWSLTCNQIVALHPLSFVLCCHCLSLQGDISCQCPLKLKILLVIQQQHDWDDDETLWIICDYFEDVNWRWLYLRQVLRWDQRTSWRGLTSSFPLRLGVVPCRWLPAFKRWVQSVANETAVIGRRGRERNHEKRRRERAMWERREDDHHTFHTCSADLISVSYTYEPTFSIFFLALMAMFTSSCASITAFSFCIEGKQRRGERREMVEDILWAVSFCASSLKSPSFLAAKACSHLEKYLSTSSSASAKYLSFTLPSSTMDSSCCSSWLMPSTTLLKSSLFSIVSKVLQFESEIPSLDIWRCQIKMS